MNTTSYIELYCNRFIIFFTQIIHKIQKIKKTFFFNLTVQCTPCRGCTHMTLYARRVN